MPASKGASEKVLLGLSGNVMSSVVAALLQHQGFQVIGLHFRTDDASHAEAERVSRKLGISLVVEDVSSRLAEVVMDHVVHELLANRKPEPMVMGHWKVLLGGLCARAKDLHCSRLSTGHSARVVLDPSTGLTRLLRATDAENDQSHLLFALRPGDLRQFILPVGDLTASAIDRLAVELGLDSDQEKLRASANGGFCRIPEDYGITLAETRLPDTLKQRGQIKRLDGTVIGEHEGLFRYRRGQLMTGSDEQRGEQAEPSIVVGMDHRSQSLIVGREEDLLVKEVVANEVSWIQKMDPMKDLICEVRLDARTWVKGRVTHFEHGYSRVEFDQPQKNVTPGQALVFYSGDEVLGGAFVA